MKKISFAFLLILLILTYYYNTSNEPTHVNLDKNQILKSRNLKYSFQKILLKNNQQDINRKISSMGTNSTILDEKKSSFHNPKTKEIFRVNYTLIQQKEVAKRLEKEIEDDEIYIREHDIQNEEKLNALERKKQLLEEMNQIIDVLEAENYHQPENSNE